MDHGTEAAQEDRVAGHAGSAGRTTAPAHAAGTSLQPGLIRGLLALYTPGMVQDLQKLKSALDGNLVLGAAGVLPFFKKEIAAARVLADTGTMLLEQVMGLLEQVAEEYPPEKLYSKGSVNLECLEVYLAFLDHAGPCLREAAADLRGVEASVVPQVKDALSSIRPGIEEAVVLLDRLGDLPFHVMDLLGAQSPRSYAIVLQRDRAQEQELAGSGDKPGPQAAPKAGPQAVMLPIAVDAGTVQLGEARAVECASSGATGTAGSTAGVAGDQLLVDASAVASFLELTGPVKLPDGELLSAQNAEELLLDGISGNGTGNSFYIQVATAVTRQLLGSSVASDPDPGPSGKAATDGNAGAGTAVTPEAATATVTSRLQGIIGALEHAFAAGQVQLRMADPAEQEALEHLLRP